MGRCASKQYVQEDAREDEDDKGPRLEELLYDETVRSTALPKELQRTGTLFLTVHEVTLLPAAGSWRQRRTLNDLYLLFRSQLLEPSSLQKTLHSKVANAVEGEMAKAQWDPEHSHFDLAFSDHEPLVLVLMDKDRFNPDDKLGEVSLPAADIKDRFGRSPEAAETSVVNGLQLTDDKGVPVAALGVSGYWLPLADDERFSKGANHNRPDAVRSKYSPARENLFFGTNTPEAVYKFREALKVHFDTIKTGDVIAFATSCDTSSAVMDKFHEAVAWAGKGIPYTHAEICYVTRNPTTGEKEIFMIGATHNNEFGTDFIVRSAFARNSIYCFPMQENLEKADATILLHRLKTPMTDEQIARLEMHLSRAYMRDPKFDNPQLFGLGVLRVLGLHKLRKDDWQRYFCSELVAASLTTAGVKHMGEDRTASATMPSDFARMDQVVDPIPVVLKLLDQHKDLYTHCLDQAE